MGRARGSAPAVAANSFTAVFGERRGTPAYSLSGAGTTGARGELERLLAAVAADNLVEPLRMLRQHRRQLKELETHPLLRELLTALAERVCVRDTERRTLIARAGLRGAGIAEAAHSPHIVAWTRGGQTKLHVWADGHRHPADRGPRSYGTALTVCRRDMTGVAWGRAARGAWAAVAEREGPREVSLCRKCLEGAPGLEDFAEHTDNRFFAPAQTLAAATRERALARSTIVAALGGDSASELPLELRLQEAYRQQLVDELAGAATANGEFVLNNLLSFKDALTLVGPGNQLHLDDYARWADTLHLEDWRRMLNAAAPNMSSPLWDSTVWSQRLAGAVFETLQDRAA